MDFGIDSPVVFDVLRSDRSPPSERDFAVYLRFKKVFRSHARRGAERVMTLKASPRKHGEGS